MRVLITGAGGTLGQALIPRLAAAGHETVAFDLRSGGDDVRWVEGDIRDLDAVREATAGADIVVHAVALHGIHLAAHPPREFHDINLTGSFNVWEAAVEHKVRGVVFCSTMGVYGETRKPAGDDDVVFVDEEIPLEPGDVYGWTKVAGEDLCRYHLRRDGIPSVALRFGMFVPEPFFHDGIRLLYGGVHEGDVAGAVLASLVALDRGEVRHEAFNVESRLPFTAEDSSLLRHDVLAAIERHYPGAAALLSERGVRALRPIAEIFPVRRLEQRLGFRPRHDFGEWLEQLRSRTDEQAPNDLLWRID